MNARPDSIPARGAASASRLPHIGQLVRQSFAAMTTRERARLIAMYGVIAGLHVAGFVILFVFVVPSHYQGLGVGVAVLAYTLGLRRAFDADHISVIGPALYSNHGGGAAYCGTATPEHRAVVTRPGMSAHYGLPARHHQPPPASLPKGTRRPGADGSERLPA
jgi:hypothetical protein